MTRVRSERYGDFAAVFYVSHETVKPMPAATADSAQHTQPSVIAIRWAEYLVRDRGRWVSVGYSGVPCSEAEPADSPCHPAAR